MRAALAVLLGTVVFAQAEAVRIHGSSTLGQAVQSAVPVIKERLGIEVQLNTKEGSSAALFSIGRGMADLAMVSRAVTQEERSDFPKKRFFDLQIGVQVLVPIVSRETWDAGVKSISKDDFIALYEGDLRTWKKAGADDLAVKFFNPERDRGVWELFATWLYGDVRRAPLGKKWDTVATHQQARDLVEFTKGSISVAAPRWADGKRVIALPVVDGEGALIEPTETNFHNNTWPMARSFFLVTAEKPTGNVRKVMEIIAGPVGAEAMSKVDFVQAPDAAAKLAEMALK